MAAIAPPPFPGGLGIPNGSQPLFTQEGPLNYQRAFQLFHASAKPSTTNYQTQLTPQQEDSFRQWVFHNNVPFDPNAKIVDYDMRGFFKAAGGKGWAPGQHFPDTFKTPYDTSFSNQSKYAVANNPYVWFGQTLIDKRTGNVIFDVAHQLHAAVKGHK